MKRYSFHALTGLFLVALLVVATAGVSAAKTHHLATATLKTALSSASIPVGSTATDTATVTGKASDGAPTGTVTFGVCGPTTSATPCTAADVAASATGTLSPGAQHRSTVTATIDPPGTGWYCLLDQYSGDGHYKPAVDNATASECLDVTGSTSTSTPTLASSLNPATVTAGNSSLDTATVTGNSSAGSPTGTVTFGLCGPTASATPCTAANVVASAPGDLSPQSGDSSTVQAQINPPSTGWYCLLDQYSGDANYSPVSDNATATQCLHVTGSSSSASERSGAAAWVTPAPPSAAAAAAVAPAPGSRSGPSLVSSIG